MKIKKDLASLVACVLISTTIFSSAPASAYSAPSLNSQENEIYRTIQSDLDNWIENDPIYVTLYGDKKRFYKEYLSTAKDDRSGPLFSKLIVATLKQAQVSANSSNIYKAYLNTRDIIFLNSHSFINEKGSLVAARFNEQMVRCFLDKQNLKTPPIKNINFIQTNQACTIQTFSDMSFAEFAEYLTVRMSSEVKALIDGVDKISRKPFTFAPFNIRAYEGRENILQLLSPSWSYFSQEDKNIINGMLDEIDKSHDPVVKRALRRYIWFIALGNERDESRKERIAQLFVNYPYYSLVDGL